MTKRETKLCQTILTVLHDLDGGQFSEIQIHAELNLHLGQYVPSAELQTALALCDTRRWITGVKSKFTGMLWNITDAGEAVRLEMH